MQTSDSGDLRSLLRLLPWVFFFSFLPFGFIFPYLVDDLHQKEASHMGLLLAMPSIMTMLSGPLWGMLADWKQDWKIVLRIASVLSVIGLYILWQASTEWLFVGMFIYSLGSAPIGPIVDALTLETVEKQTEFTVVSPKKYGDFRLWGSMGYMVGVLTIAICQLQYPVTGLGMGTIFTGLFTLMAFWLPVPKRNTQHQEDAKFSQLFGNFELLWLLACAALHFSVHLANSSFLLQHFKLHLAPEDLPEIWNAVAMALGVVVEIVVLLWGGRLLERWNAITLFRCAAILAIFRWIVMAISAAIVPLVLAQMTHGITFGLFWLASVALVKRYTPPKLAGTGQSLLGAAVGGVGAAGGMFGASWIVERYSTVEFYWCAVAIACVSVLMSFRIR